MDKRIYLVRHGKTQGNLEGRYIGNRTDESLCAEGKKRLETAAAHGLFRELPESAVYSSPMKRALETAEILFPNRTVWVIDRLTEIDFGAFENKNFEELNGNPAYQAFIDSDGEVDYPEGEKTCDFIKRSVAGFREVIARMLQEGQEEAAVICHGGSIMAVMSTLTGEGYFDFQVACGGGFCVVLKIEDGDVVNLVSFSRF